MLLIQKNIAFVYKTGYNNKIKYQSGDRCYGYKCRRRYTNEKEGVDSFVCVSITNGATFNNIPNGKYVDAITGDVKNVTNGTLSIPSVGKGNMRVYVLNGPGTIGEDGAYLK